MNQCRKLTKPLLLPGNSEQEHYHNAKLALLSQLCQTRDGAKYVLHAGLFRAIEQSGLFAVDPELQVSSADPTALERHYALLVKVTRVLGAAIISRASHNVLQGRRFLTEHRMLVMHVLKRSAGIGAGGTGQMERKLGQRIDELAEALLLIISATEFLEVRQKLSDNNPGRLPGASAYITAEGHCVPGFEIFRKPYQKLIQICVN